MPRVCDLWLMLSMPNARFQIVLVTFIDCTLRRMCRPTIAQQAAYNGHKKCYKKTHGLKWQNIVAPDGIIINQWGPFEGRRSDPWIVGELAPAFEE